VYTAALPHTAAHTATECRPLPLRRPQPGTAAAHCSTTRCCTAGQMGTHFRVALPDSHTLPRALPHTTANCRTAPHWRTAGQPHTACTRELSDSRTLLQALRRTLQRALPHLAAQTAAHCRTATYCRTAALPHSAALLHSRTLLRTLSHTEVHTAHTA
jgi:hypothetical protein